MSCIADLTNHGLTRMEDPHVYVVFGAPSKGHEHKDPANDELPNPPFVGGPGSGLGSMLAAGRNLQDTSLGSDYIRVPSFRLK